MIPCIRVKDGAEFTRMTPASFEIFAGLTLVAGRIGHDVTITSACDGQHSGPDDPHKKGEAYDIRTHDLPDKQQALNMLQLYLGTTKFYAFLEDAGTENEHIHCQLRHGIMYP